MAAKSDPALAAILRSVIDANKHRLTKEEIAASLADVEDTLLAEGLAAAPKAFATTIATTSGLLTKEHIKEAWESLKSIPKVKKPTIDPTIEFILSDGDALNGPVKQQFFVTPSGVTLPSPFSLSFDTESQPVGMDLKPPGFKLPDVKLLGHKLQKQVYNLATNLHPGVSKVDAHVDWDAGTGMFLASVSVALHAFGYEGKPKFHASAQASYAYEMVLKYEGLPEYALDAIRVELKNVIPLKELFYEALSWFTQSLKAAVPIYPQSSGNWDFGWFDHGLNSPLIEISLKHYDNFFGDASKTILGYVGKVSGDLFVPADLGKPFGNIYTTPPTKAWAIWTKPSSTPHP
jgi:hypothetical protein